MDTNTAKQLTSAVRYAVKMDKSGRPRDRPATPEEEAVEAIKNFYRIRQGHTNGRLRRQLIAMQEINGTGCRRSEDECDCGRGNHVKLIVVKNGKDLSGPLCPRVIAIRRLRLDVAARREPDPNLLQRLLREAAIENPD